MSISPIRPEELSVKIPDFVISAINKLLKERCRYTDKEIIIKQKDIIREVIKITSGDINGNDLLENRYLDFEELFVKYGWNVTYKEPNYRGEIFDPYYIFSKRKKQYLWL